MSSTSIYLSDKPSVKSSQTLEAVMSDYPESSRVLTNQHVRTFDALIGFYQQEARRVTAGTQNAQEYQRICNAVADNNVPAGPDPGTCAYRQAKGAYGLEPGLPQWHPGFGDDGDTDDEDETGQSWYALGESLAKRDNKIARGLVTEMLTARDQAVHDDPSLETQTDDSAGKDRPDLDAMKADLQDLPDSDPTESWEMIQPHSGKADRAHRRRHKKAHGSKEQQ